MARALEVWQDEEIRGRNVPGDPARRVTRYWAKDGTLLAETDPHGLPGIGNCIPEGWQFERLGAGWRIVNPAGTPVGAGGPTPAAALQEALGLLNAILSAPTNGQTAPESSGDAGAAAPAAPAPEAGT